MNPLLAVLLAVSALGPVHSRDRPFPSPTEFLKTAAEVEVPEVKQSKPVPFLMTELRMEAFKGADSERTRANVQSFVKKLGRTMTSYQDNETVRALDVRAEDKSSSLRARARRYLLMRKTRSILETGSLVESVREMSNGSLSAVFKRPLYKEEFESLLSKLPEGVKASYWRNEAMKGVWIHLAVDGSGDPEAAAAALAKAHPREISSCKAMIQVRVMEIRSGGD